MKYSIVIPFHNRSSKVIRCLSSITNTRMTDYEIVLVNDGSDNESSQTVYKYSEQYKQIKNIHLQHSGVSHARNIGIDQSQGDMIIFIDSDDYIDSNEFRAALPNSCCEDEIYSYSFIKRDNTGNILNEVEFCDSDMSVLAFTDYYIKNSFDMHLMNPVWNKVYSSRLLKDKVRFNENCRYGEDLDFNMKVLQNINKVKQSSKKYYNYIIDLCQSVSTAYCPDFLVNERISLNGIIDTFTKLGIIERYKNDLISHIEQRLNRGIDHIKEYDKNIDVINKNEILATDIFNELFIRLNV